MLLIRYASHPVKRERGFTLIESIIAMVLLAFAMVTLATFLYPQVERSARPHYQIRAAELQQGLMNRILALPFDQNSGRNGREVRCQEKNTSCTAPNLLGADDSETPTNFNDVDDFIGCWYSDHSTDCGSQPTVGQLSELLGMNMTNQYAHFTVTIGASYIDSSGQVSGVITDLKRIKVVVDTGKYGNYSLVGFRGNY
ncbi:MAG: type IV pilus modification PilV family protein [Vibrio sp.]